MGPIFSFADVKQLRLSSPIVGANLVVAIGVDNTDHFS